MDSSKGLFPQFFGGAIEGDFVEPEYFSGILAASSILFGLWIIVLTRTPKDENKEKFAFEVDSFFICLIFLMVSVIAITLTAVNLFSDYIALFLSTSSFCINVFMLGVILNKKLKNSIE